MTTGPSKPLLPQPLIPMTTTSLMKEAQLVMFRQFGAIQSTSSGQPNMFNLMVTKLDDVLTVLHALLSVLQRDDNRTYDEIPDTLCPGV